MIMFYQLLFWIELTAMQ